MAAVTADSSSDIWWVGYEANGRWRGRGVVYGVYCLRPLSLSAPSCKAGMYAHCQLKTMETGDERLLLELWVMRGPTCLGITLPVCFLNMSFYCLNVNACCV